jgi:hypothetical protein
MSISLADINRLTLRTCFLPWFKTTMAQMGITLPPDWNPDDEELESLAQRVGEAMREEAD